MNIEKIIDSKALLIIFNCLNGTAPTALSMLLSVKSENDLSIYYRKLRENFYMATKFGHKSFAFYAPKLWNNLPRYLSLIDNLNSFKTSLKTYLFTNFYEYKSPVNRIISILWNLYLQSGCLYRVINLLVIARCVIIRRQ